METIDMEILIQISLIVGFVYITGYFMGRKSKGDDDYVHIP